MIGRSLRGGWLGAVVLATLSGCQVVFDLEGYGAAPEQAAGAGGAGAAGTTTGEGTTSDASSSTGAGAAGGGGGSGTDACAGLAPEPSGGEGICALRKAKPLNNGGPSLLSPSASCNGAACDVFLQKGFGEAVLCASCSDLPGLVCDAPVTVSGLPGGASNPYLRAGGNELWFTSGGELHHASVNGCAVSGDTTVGAPVSSAAAEAYPAISPGGKTLFFTRVVAGAQQLFVAHRDVANGAFTAAVAVGGIRDGVGASVLDLRPQPVWEGQEDVTRLYFSSTRLGADPSDAEELDVFVAERASGAAWDDPFTSVTLVATLTTPVADLAPTPVTDTLWLWARDENAGGTSSRIYVADVGCASRFDPPLRDAFAAVDTSDHEGDASFDGAGRLLFSRADGAGDAELYSSAEDAGGVFGAGNPYAPADVAHVAGTADSGPIALADGRLLFVSDRETPGVPKLWLTVPGDAPERVTTTPASVAETTPFVDAAGELWLSFSGGSDSAGRVLARAAKSGESWGALQEVPGLGHEVGSNDEAPRLADGGKLLLFTSTRDGGLSPGVATVWIAKRADPGADAWDSPFPLPGLGTVLGVSAPWIDPKDCSLTYGLYARETGFSLDLVRAYRSP